MGRKKYEKKVAKFNQIYLKLISSLVEEIKIYFWILLWIILFLGYCRRGGGGGLPFNKNFKYLEYFLRLLLRLDFSMPEVFQRIKK